MKRLLIFRFENVLINIEPDQYLYQKAVWTLLRELKTWGYKLGLITSLGFEEFTKAATSSDLVRSTIHWSFDCLIQNYQPEHQFDELLRFAEKNEIKKEEIVYFGCHFSDLQAVQQARIDFIGVIDHLPASELLDIALSDDEKTHPVLLAEFLSKYLAKV